MTHINPLHSLGTDVTPREDRLRKVVGQLEGVFVEQLFKAMRETVPADGIVNGGPGEAMFTGMLDQHMAAAVPGQWNHGIGESLYRQLFQQLPPALSPPSVSADATADATADDTAAGHGVAR